MVPLLHSVVILANSSATALLKDSKKSYLMLPSKLQMTKPETLKVYHKPLGAEICSQTVPTSSKEIGCNGQAVHNNFLLLYQLISVV